MALSYIIDGATIDETDTFQLESPFFIVKLNFLNYLKHFFQKL